MRTRSALPRRNLLCAGVTERHLWWSLRDLDQQLWAANRFAQTFTAERSGSLRQIQFSVNKKPATTGDYLVQLLKVVGGKPSHSPSDMLAALTVPDAAVATSCDATLTATFAGPALVAGTEYAAAFSRPGSTSAGANYRKSDGSACGGDWFNADGAGPFNVAQAQDLLVSVIIN